jgi:phospholipid/cholesterol/gamma-HCH transport system substrate-binding protein
MRMLLLKVAGFLVVTGAFTAWLAITIGNIQFRDTYTLTATFDDVTGLAMDDNVKVAGVVVGKVRGIEIIEGRARVRFTVDRDVDVPVDSEAAIRWRNLLGQRYLYVYPGESPEHLGGGDAIAETRSVIDLGELFNRLGPIVAAIDPKQVNVFLDSVTAALDGNEQRLAQAIDDLGSFAAAIATRDEQIGSLVEDLDVVAGTIADRDRQIRQVLDDLVVLATTFSANTDVVDAAVLDLGRFSAALGELLAANRSEIDGSLTSLATLLETVRGKLGTLDGALEHLDDTSEAIFRSASYGEWLNQTILCAAFGPPPPGQPCASPIVKGASAPAPSSRASGVDAIAGVLRRLDG